MGKFFTSGHETRWNDFELGVCPTPSDCEGSGGTCESTEWSNISTAGRISSVQATIELEKPQDYPKDRTSKITKRIDGIEKETLRYKRPDEYEGNEEDFPSLCAFPGRECGYPEDEEHNICYPFDGTYDIYTLGEAVEELISGHYVDGSDDPLLVYLYERPNMIEKEVVK